MDNGDESEYSPLRNARGTVSDNSRIQPEKNATPMLRVFIPNNGKLLKPMLNYGNVDGGEQADDDTWFEVYYHGIIRYSALNDRVSCEWIIRVEGEKLEPVCRLLCKHTLPVLKVGKSEDSQQPYNITNITIKPYAPAILTIEARVVELGD